MSRRVARFNRVISNNLIGRVAGWMPGFGYIWHQGRRSGRTYRTPVNVFREPDGFVVALTYGSQSDWVKNVLAAGGCELTTRRKRYRMHDPRIVVDHNRTGMPPFVKFVLKRTDVSEFLHLTRKD